MEKMRELRRALKATRDRLRAYASFPQEHAAFLRQKAEALKERARQWRTRLDELSLSSNTDAPQSPDVAETSPPRWQRVWPQTAAHETAIPTPLPQSAAPGIPASWHERLPNQRRLLKTAGLLLLIFLGLPYGLILVYRLVDPPFSALMARQWLGGVAVHQRWVDFDDISPALPTAVIVSEDAGFCRHWGVDWNAVGEALEQAEDGEGLRGASTIPMQTAKNLFLWNGQNFIRKILEVPLAYALSAVWPKQRVLEVYLNVAEWGPGIFGAEAAARYHFRKSAADLSPREAALLAAALPSPRTRNAGRPNGLTARIAARIGARVGREAQAAACVFPRNG